MTSYGERSLLNFAAFQLKGDPVVPEEDCLFASILLQPAKHHSKSPDETFKVQNNVGNTGLADFLEGDKL